MNLLEKSGIYILKISGELTIKTHETFRQWMNKLLMSDSDQLILYLNQVNYISSAALGTIARTVMNAKKMNKEFVVSGVRPPNQMIFDMVKFSAFIKLFTTLEEAEDFLVHFKKE